MRSTTILTLGAAFVLLLPAESMSQIGGFYPPVDTMILGGGCTTPFFYWTVSDSVGLDDTVRIYPGLWTSMWYLDSVRSSIFVSHCYFTARDPLHDLQFECWRQPLMPLGEPVLVLPDSEFMCREWHSRVSFFAKRGGIVVDSISKIFVAEYGLGVRENDGVAAQYVLEQNHPNPFNPTTSIRYEVPQEAVVSLKVFNVLGQEVAALLDGLKEPGSYEVQWNAKNLPSGVYFYRLQAGDFVQTKKLVILK